MDHCAVGEIAWTGTRPTLKPSYESSNHNAVWMCLGMLETTPHLCDAPLNKSTINSECLGTEDKVSGELKAPQRSSVFSGNDSSHSETSQEHAEIWVRVHQALALTSYKSCRMCLPSSPETCLCSWAEISTTGNLALHLHLTDVSDFGFCLGGGR